MCGRIFLQISAKWPRCPSNLSFPMMPTNKELAAVWEPSCWDCRLSSALLPSAQAALCLPVSAAAPCLVLAGHLKELHKQLCVCSACAGASRTQASCTASMAEHCATAGARYQLRHSTLWKQPCSGHGAGQPSTAECKDVSSDDRESPWAAGKPHAVGSDSPRSVCGQCNVFFVNRVCQCFSLYIQGFCLVK